jgi:prevent-host-death family protein
MVVLVRPSYSNYQSCDTIAPRMRQTVSTIELRRRLGEILDRVALRQDEFVISRKDRPMAAIVPVEVLESLQQAAKLQLLDALERAGSQLTPEQADALADEAKHATRPPPSE